MNKIQILVLVLFISFATSRLLYPSLVKKIAQKNAERRKFVDLTVDSELPDPQPLPTPTEIRPNVWAGYESVYNHGNNSAGLYFIFYGCRSCQTPLTQVPVVIWLQGGPGGSSQLGNFIEMGPNQVVQAENGTYYETPRNLSWNDYYNLLIVDNPVGTGFSIADTYRSNEIQIADDFVNFLVNFYADYQNFSTTPLYIFGESYAGHYIPSISNGILNYNQAGPALTIPLKGIGIGDGWTDPINQLSEYGLFSYSLGLTDDVQKQSVEYYQIDGVFAIQQTNWDNALNDFDNVIGTIQSDAGGINEYNFRDFGEYNFDYLTDYLTTPSVAAAYNTANFTTWQSENTDVYAGLLDDFMQSVAANVSYVKTQIPVMLYNGQDDLIVCYPTAANWIGLMYSNADDSSFYNAPLQVWLLANGTNAGLAKQAGNFTFVVVNKAGHLAPMDQIESTTDMINRFIQGQTNWTLGNWSSSYV